MPPIRALQRGFYSTLNDECSPGSGIGTSPKRANTLTSLDRISLPRLEDGNENLGLPTESSSPRV